VAGWRGDARTLRAGGGGGLRRHILRPSCTLTERVPTVGSVDDLSSGTEEEKYQKVSRYYACSPDVTAGQADVRRARAHDRLHTRGGSGNRRVAFPLRRGKWSPTGSGASPAAATNGAANGAPLAGGRFVAPPLVEGKHIHVPETTQCSLYDMRSARRALPNDTLALP
jgi:hypothetical protein